MKCYVLISSIHPSFLLHLVSIHLSIHLPDNARMHVLEPVAIRTPNYWNILLSTLRLWYTLTFGTRLPDILYYRDTLLLGTFSGHAVIGHIYYRTHYYSDMQHDSLRIKTNLDTPFDREMLNFIKVGSRPGQGRLLPTGCLTVQLAWEKRHYRKTSQVLLNIKLKIKFWKTRMPFTKGVPSM